jgi:methylmalonyl-CoA mutase C-terminal domain/subunit
VASALSSNHIVGLIVRPGYDQRRSGVSRAGRSKEIPSMTETASAPSSASGGGPAGRIRVVVAKPGLDGHDRGAKVVARALRDAGMEVIYTGLHQTPEQIVNTAIQEDADAIGLSVLSGAHMTLFAKVMELLKEQGADDVVVLGGGIIPEDDIGELKALGVAEVFTPGATTRDIVGWITEHVNAAAAGANSST